MERTFVMIKPDAVKRGLIGEIIRRFENKGFRIVALKMMEVSQDLAERHYEVHKGKPFYSSLIQFITSGPVVAMVLEAPEAIALARSIIGATRPTEATPGSIRGDFATTTQENLVHGSDSQETAEFEIRLWFGEEYITPKEKPAV